MEIFGTSRDDLNGCVAVCHSFSHKKGRYVVQLENEDSGTGSKPKPFMLKPTNVRSAIETGAGGGEQLEATSLADDAGPGAGSQRSGQASHNGGLSALSTLAALRGAEPALIEVAEMLGVVYKGSELRHLKECYGQLQRGTSNFYLRTRVPLPLTFR